MKMEKVRISTIKTRIDGIILFSLACLSVFPFSFSISLTQTSSGDLPERELGGFAHYIFNMHSADFTGLKGIATCCPRFQDGTGYGYAIGAFFDFRLPLNLSLGLKAVYSKLDGKMTTPEGTYVRIGDKLVPGQFDHILTSSIADIGLEPFVSYNPFAGLKLYFGAHAGLYSASNFDYVEQISLPADRGVFVDSGTRSRNKQSGSIPDKSSIYGAVLGGIGYDLPLNSSGSLKLSPEVFYYQGLSNVAQNINWKLSSFRAGVSVKYIFIPVPFVVPTEYHKKEVIDTITVISDAIDSRYFKPGIMTSSVTENKTDTLISTIETFKRTDTLFVLPAPKAELKMNTNEIRVKTQFVTEAFPLLPMVFFDKNSADLNGFYEKIKWMQGFSAEKLRTNPIEFNRNVLNIIGERLYQNNKAGIRIKGLADSTTEKGNCDLARQRAEAVKSYLVDTWKIEPERISISDSKPPCQPRNATVTPNDSGFAENRRIEIESDDHEILSPILRKRFLETYSVEPDTLLFDPSGSTGRGISSWSVVLKQDGRNFYEKDSTGSPAIERKKITPEEALQFPSGQVINAELYLTNNDNKTAMAALPVSIFRDTLETELQRMSLVLFDVGSDEISKNSRAIIKSFIKGLGRNSAVRVVGYTDALGLQENNIDLSKRRAKNVAAIIRSIDPQANIEEISGVGSTRMPPGIESYSTPSERFLCRTVQVEIIKKRD